MQTSTENVDSQNMTQTQEKKRRETSVKNLIGYEWKEARDGAKIEVVNPATSELTASSTSSSVTFGTVSISSLVAGFTTSILAPSRASFHS